MLTVEDVKAEIFEWSRVKFEDFLLQRPNLRDNSMFRLEDFDFEHAWQEFYGVIHPNIHHPDKDTTVILKSGPANMVDCFGGENQGSELWLTFSLANQFFRMDGKYDSYGGNEWLDLHLYEVFPKECKAITYIPKLQP